MSVRTGWMQNEVLAVLQRHDVPLSAYRVLEHLRKDNPKLAPTTIYRARGALTERGCVHRLESLNAYIVCQCEAHGHASILSICEDCGTVQETVASELLQELSEHVGQSGFTPMRHVIEVHGLFSPAAGNRLYRRRNRLADAEGPARCGPVAGGAGTLPELPDPFPDWRRAEAA